MASAPVQPAVTPADSIASIIDLQPLPGAQFGKVLEQAAEGPLKGRVILPVVPVAQVVGVRIRCDHCDYWQPTGNVSGATTGKCRKNSPVGTLEAAGAGNGVWPTTASDDKCMEHSTIVRGLANPTNEFYAAYQTSGDKNYYNMLWGGSYCYDIVGDLAKWDSFQNANGIQNQAIGSYNVMLSFVQYLKTLTIVSSFSVGALNGCKTCENWDGGVNGTTGKCRRLALTPKLNDGEAAATAIFPVTHKFDWCSYYRHSQYLANNNTAAAANPTPH